MLGIEGMLELLGDLDPSAHTQAAASQCLRVAVDASEKFNLTVWSLLPVKCHSLQVSSKEPSCNKIPLPWGMWVGRIRLDLRLPNVQPFSIHPAPARLDQLIKARSSKQV